MRNFILAVTMLCVSVVSAGVYDKMPKHRYSLEVRDLEVGDHVYIVSWAVQLDSDGYAWVAKDTKFSKNCIEGSDVGIYRDEKGFHLDLSYCDHKWRRSLYLGFNEENHLKILTIKDDSDG